MSEIWSAPCPSCKGSGDGKKIHGLCNGTGQLTIEPCSCADGYIFIDCLRCKGAKEVVLVVPCCNGPKINGKQACGACEDYACTDGYRPLTVSEVEEMGVAEKTIETFELLGSPWTFKSQPVRVAPKEAV